MTKRPANSQSGFTLLELMIVMFVFLIVMAAIMMQTRTVTQRSANERIQLDLFQESREFMDQMSRDLRQVGYPNARNFAPGTLNCTGASTLTAPQCAGGPIDSTTNTSAAVGLVFADVGDLFFQGGLDDDGKVLYTQYHYDNSTDGNCPCIRRSQQVRAAISGTETANYQTEVQNVQNFTASTPVPIFTFYTNGGTQQVAAGNLPLTWGVNNEALANIDTIRIQLQVKSPYRDLQTGKSPIITLVSTVRVNNCSQSPTGQLSCQN